MKKLPQRLAACLCLLLSAGALSPGLHAAEDTIYYHYQGEVAGVVCNVCANNVKQALSKLPGVREVKITLNKSGGNPRLTVLSTSPELTRAAAVKALGKAAEHYDIRSLEKAATR